jgi:hypothetical protein
MLFTLDVQVFLRHSGKGRNPVALTFSGIPGLRLAVPGVRTITVLWQTIKFKMVGGSKRTY